MTAHLNTLLAVGAVGEQRELDLPGKPGEPPPRRPHAAHSRVVADAAGELDHQPARCRPTAEMGVVSRRKDDLGPPAPQMPPQGGQHISQGRGTTARTARPQRRDGKCAAALNPGRGHGDDVDISACLCEMAGEAQRVVGDTGQGQVVYEKDD